MLNFKKSIYAFMAIMMTMAFAGLSERVPIWIFLLPIAGFIFMVVYGSANIGSGFFMHVTCRNEESEDEIAITFDDGPDPETTLQVLDILKQNDIKATFFCIGEKVTQYPEVVQRIAGDGHLIGNHSFTHSTFFDFFSHDSMVREIRNTNKIIEKTVGKRIHLFRPPFGVTTPVLAKAIKKTKMIPVGWSLRSMDTVTKDPKKLIAKINKQLVPGDVILLHDTCPVTVRSLQQIIDDIRKKGLKIVPADKLLHVNAYV